MNKYTREQLFVLAKLTPEDLEEVERRGRDHNTKGAKTLSTRISRGHINKLFGLLTRFRFL